VNTGSKAEITRHLLERLADERLLDFETLVVGGRYAAAIYLGIYGVECLLKAQICKSLDLDELPAVYEKHHLLTLLLHSGLWKRIQQAPGVYHNLSRNSTAFGILPIGSAIFDISIQLATMNGPRLTSGYG
jgi:hypothetical protein